MTIPGVNLVVMEALSSRYGAASYPAGTFVLV